MLFKQSLIGLLTLVVSAPLMAAGVAYHISDLEDSNYGGVSGSIAFSAGHDDNVSNLENDEISSTSYRVEPQASVALKREHTRFGINYHSYAGWYQDNSDDDYWDNAIQLYAHHEFSARHKLIARYQYKHGHIERGLGVSEGQQDSYPRPPKFDDHYGYFEYQFGVKDALFNLDLHLRVEDFEYTNFKERLKTSNYEVLEYGGTAYIRVSPATKLTFDGFREDIDYKYTPAGAVTRDNHKYGALAGMTWDLTARTSGFAKAGYEKKEFDRPDIDSYDGFSWDLGVNWELKSYSVFTLSSSKRAMEPDLDGDVVDRESIRLRWTHDWNDKVNTELAGGYSNEDFEGTADNRVDKVTESYASIGYDYTNWLTLQMSWKYRNVDSNRDLISHDKNVILFSTIFSL
ncbi:outer membrane beta-barrel protein [Echinimonas agarilytica]|uniref:Outer membrane beta-barrel protein n=1 Tax=Echinimonas agarilytica TaxID=1215918 RepID=A0AA41W980_9GAMM|nr:outer membrane beta-barrel protein [Echinimonas agarilytica]MCM2681440.1 outer membrane beta-barrel protein [Echinimonas agarilytica]